MPASCVISVIIAHSTRLENAVQNGHVRWTAYGSSKVSKVLIFNLFHLHMS